MLTSLWVAICCPAGIRLVVGERLSCMVVWRGGAVFDAMADLWGTCLVETRVSCRFWYAANDDLLSGRFSKLVDTIFG